jgi:spore coat-associated protein N
MEAKMKRFKVLFGQRRFQGLITIAAIMLAASVVVASGANFTSTSANADNVFTAGNLSHYNSKAGSAIFTVTKMKPGDKAPGTVIITNDGDIAGDFTLTNSSVTNPVLPALSTLLTVKIWSTKLLPLPAGTKTLIYGGDGLAAIAVGVNPALSLGTFAVGESRQYDFEVTFPDGSPAHDNLYKKASMSVNYDWTAVQ